MSVCVCVRMRVCVCVRCRLEGHQAPVLAAAFCSPHQPHWLITAGEDRTFALWDLEEATLLYQVHTHTHIRLLLALAGMSCTQ